MMLPLQAFDLTGPLPSGMTLLEASAGTGKTYAIASLATRLLAEGTAEIEQLMLVTFSRMATAELRDRVRGRLEEVERALSDGLTPHDDALVTQLTSVTPDERVLRSQRLRSALARFDDAMIATTHEFCARMLAVLGSLADQEPLGVLVEDLDDLVVEVTHDLYLGRFADAERPPFTLGEAERLAREAIARREAVLVAPDDSPSCRERTDFLEAVRAEVEVRKHRRGVYTFDDMLTRLRDALADPQTGDLARDRIAERFHWVLIDEFQDTDRVQWEIVRDAFADRPEVNVVLIGDPKQAIYGFRGADVGSYLAVDAGTRLTLNRNWRSDRRLVDALGNLLVGTELGNPKIVVHPVTAQRTDSRLRADGEWADPVRVRLLPGDGAGTPISTLRQRMRDDLVRDIRSLVDSNAQLEIAGKLVPIAYRHIAVLVRRAQTGKDVLEALQAAGVPAVFAGAASVYATQAAQDWLTLLIALAEPSIAHHRAAALTALVGWTFPQLATASEEQLSQHSQTLRGWARTLEETGMVGLTETIMREHAVAPRLLARSDGERVLTDLRHVAQLLQSAQAQRGLALPGLIDWLRDRVEHVRSNEGDDRSRRLETDAEAVTIMTIHRSKGLEFPVVYLPDVGDVFVRDRDDGAPLVVHERRRVGSNGPEVDTVVMDVGGSNGGRRRHRFAVHQEEDAGEELRKLYVALTRAQCQVTAWWYPHPSNGSRSPLHRLLMRDRRQGAPEPAYPATRPAGLPNDRGIAIQEVPLEPSAPSRVQGQASMPTLLAAEFTRQIDREWRRTSYTGLTSGAHEAGVLPTLMREDDESAPQTPGDDALAVNTEPPEHTDILSPMADLPGGPQFGSLVHALLENLDTAARPLESAVLEQARHWLARIPVPGLDASALTTALMPALGTELGPLADHLSLAEIPLSDRLPELDFELELVGHHRPTLADLANLMAAHLPADDPLAAYPAMLRAPGLGEQPLTGFLTGSIDVLLRVGTPPRYVVVDYKTNRIGPLGAPVLVGAYTHSGMAEAMMTAHYPLQALLYAVATHRFLQVRQRGYDPQRYLGGVLYLFVRGMAGAEAVDSDGRPFGVFDWSPPAALIVALSDLLSGQAVPLTQEHA